MTAPNDVYRGVPRLAQRRVPRRVWYAGPRERQPRLEDHAEASGKEYASFVMRRGNLKNGRVYTQRSAKQVDIRLHIFDGEGTCLVHILFGGSFTVMTNIYRTRIDMNVSVSRVSSGSASSFVSMVQYDVRCTKTWK